MVETAQQYWDRIRPDIAASLKRRLEAWDERHPTDEPPIKQCPNCGHQWRHDGEQKP
jgi:hypothetical protein